MQLDQLGPISKNGNGLGPEWDNRGNVLFLIDTGTDPHTIIAYHFELGIRAKIEFLIELPIRKISRRTFGFPDGMCIRTKAKAFAIKWLSTFIGGSGVLSLDPTTGELIEKVELLLFPHI